MWYLVPGKRVVTDEGKEITFERMQREKERENENANDRMLDDAAAAALISNTGNGFEGDHIFRTKCYIKR